MHTKAMKQTALLMSGLIVALMTAIALGIGLMQLGAPGSGGRSAVYRLCLAPGTGTKYLGF